MGKAIPRSIRRHTHPQARPEAAPPPRASGIDYLGLVAARVAAETVRRIAYADMASPGAQASRGDSDVPEPPAANPTTPEERIER